MIENCEKQQKTIFFKFLSGWLNIYIPFMASDSSLTFVMGSD